MLSFCDKRIPTRHWLKTRGRPYSQGKWGTILVEVRGFAHLSRRWGAQKPPVCSIAPCVLAKQNHPCSCGSVCLGNPLLLCFKVNPKGTTTIARGSNIQKIRRATHLPRVQKPEFIDSTQPLKKDEPPICLMRSSKTNQIIHQFKRNYRPPTSSSVAPNNPYSFASWCSFAHFLANQSNDLYSFASVPFRAVF